MSVRISANFSPLQSPKSAILLSIRSDALIGADDVATALRGLAAFAATRLTAAFFATFADFLDVLPAIVFTPVLRVSLVRLIVANQAGAPSSWYLV